MNLWNGYGFSSFHDMFDNFIGIILQVFFPVFCPVTASRFIDLEEPDRIIRAKFFDQYVKSLLLDLV